MTGGPTAELAELVLVLCQGVNNPRLLRTRDTRRLQDGWTAALVGVLRPAAPPASTGGHRR